MTTNQQFPTGVYKCPGRYPGNRGRTYNQQAAANQAELDLLLGDGWCRSLPEAEDAYDLTKPQATAATPPTSTPEERAGAADALQADAAYRLNQANETLKADQQLADSAADALAEVMEESEHADRAKADFDARYADLQTRKATAQANASNTSKNLTSSKLRQAAADRALDDAAGKVLTTGDLLAEAKRKALDREVAKQRALAAAQAKETAPTAPTPPEPEPQPAAPAPTPPTDPAPPPPPAAPTAPIVTPAPATATPTTKAKGK